MDTDHTQCCVAVHVGAGYHSQEKASIYKKVMKQACIAAMERLKQGATANDAVEVAIKVLEDASVTNAGIGSNLNRVGLVECDAAIMCSKPDAFGAVGSVSAICNPIEAANAVLKSYAKGPNRHGLVPPMFLVGEGADKWARDHGICTNMDSRHKITEAALRKYEQYMDFVTSPALDKEPETTVGNASENTNALDEDVLLDTVGAVCIDMDKVIAAGVSSGGIALKHPGRIGEAAMFGCGSWAEELTDKTKKPTVLVGTSVTGTGEQIMRTMLAKNCAQPSTDIFTSLSDCFEKFNNSRSLELYTTKNAGIIMVRHDLGSNSTELGIAHTTHSMGYGYMTYEMEKPKSKISRKPQTSPTLISAIRL